MSGSPFPFGSLPFEVLLNVIGLLDHRDINSICQLSRAFDEIATPVLYECVEWGRFLWEPVAGVYPTVGSPPVHNRRLKLIPLKVALSRIPAPSSTSELRSCRDFGCW